MFDEIISCYYYIKIQTRWLKKSIINPKLHEICTILLVNPKLHMKLFIYRYRYIYNFISKSKIAWNFSYIDIDTYIGKQNWFQNGTMNCGVCRPGLEATSHPRRCEARLPFISCLKGKAPNSQASTNIKQSTCGIILFVISFPTCRWFSSPWISVNFNSANMKQLRWKIEKLKNLKNTRDSREIIWFGVDHVTSAGVCFETSQIIIYLLNLNLCIFYIFFVFLSLCFDYMFKKQICI